MNRTRSPFPVCLKGNGGLPHRTLYHIESMQRYDNYDDCDWDEWDGYDWDECDGWDDFSCSQAKAGGGASKPSTSKANWYQGKGRRDRKQDNVKSVEQGDDVVCDRAFSDGAQAGLVHITGSRACFYSVDRNNATPWGVVRPEGQGAVTASASRKGGQSAPRFQRAAEQGRAAWVRQVALALRERFADGEQCTVQAIAVSGSAELRHMLMKEKVLTEDTRLDGLLMEAEVEGESTQNHELVMACAAVLKEVRLQAQKRQAAELRRLTDPAQKAEALQHVVYGGPARKAARRGQIEILLVHEDEVVRHQEVMRLVEEQGGRVCTLWVEVGEDLQAFGGCVGLCRYAVAA